jgi:menaquinol-cytochrome c reductase iron-sulfur subunit
MEPETNRRSFLSFAIFGLGAIFSALIGVPIVCYALDPRHRKGAKSNSKLVEGIALDELTMNSPKQGVIRDVRVDGWTLYPSDVIGRVWVVQVGARPARVANLTPEQKAAYLIVFTTICPHLGCSVNLDSDGAGFACPCHNATFRLNGAQADPATNPALRGMDTLEWEFDEIDSNKIKVKYQSFKTSIANKESAG